jgi:uncharacterized RDD family membrane protein YckC
MSPATVTARLVAVAVDGIIGTCAILITLMVASQKGLAQIGSMLTDDPAAIEALAPGITAALLVALALPFLFALQVARRGATPGKAVMSLTVRNVADGRFPGYLRALGREALRFAHVAPCMILAETFPVILVVAACVVFDLSRNRLSQTWYDRVTHTVIVAPVPEKTEA